MCKMTLAVLCAVGLALGLAGAAQAAIVFVVSDASGNDPNVVSSTDLANSDQTTYSSIALTSGSELFASHVAKLVNGLMYGVSGGRDTDEGFSGSDGSAVTITLDTTANTLGYDISSISTYSAYLVARRRVQNYDIAIALVGTPTTFTSLYSVSQSGSGNEYFGYRITTTQDAGDGLLATGVSALRFTVHGGGDDVAVYRELDVFGSATPVPEPATLALLGLGGLGMLLSRKRK